jgi:hypothetical protein
MTEQTQPAKQTIPVSSYRDLLNILRRLIKDYRDYPSFSAEANQFPTEGAPVEGESVVDITYRDDNGQTVSLSLIHPSPTKAQEFASRLCRDGYVNKSDASIMQELLVESVNARRRQPRKRLLHCLWTPLAALVGALLAAYFAYWLQNRHIEHPTTESEAPERHLTQGQSLHHNSTSNESTTQPTR